MTMLKKHRPCKATTWSVAWCDCTRRKNASRIGINYVITSLLLRSGWCWCNFLFRFLWRDCDHSDQRHNRQILHHYYHVRKQFCYILLKLFSLSWLTPFILLFFDFVSVLSNFNYRASSFDFLLIGNKIYETVQTKFNVSKTR